MPPRSPGIVAVQGNAASVLYAVVASFCACNATALAKCVAPLTMPGPGGVENEKPVTELRDRLSAKEPTQLTVNSEQ